MGAVWLAEDTVLGRQVAVKKVGMVPGGAAPDLERAEREARLAARLNHPHVVAVFDLVVEDEGQWLVMEYVEGTTLAGLVSQRGPLPADEATRLLEQAASALAAAHAAGIIHRDVKPSNMLVTPDGQVKLSDFGIARAEADASLTQTGLVTGSPAYLAPEVASGHTATDASDVWSLGATLYHALSGRPPYEVGDNLMGTLFKIVHEEPPRLPTAGWLAPLLEATMTRDPADRWSMARVRDVLAAGPGSGESTQLMAPVVVPDTNDTTPTPVPDTPAEPVAPVAPVAPAPAPAAAPSRRRTPLLLIGLGLALLLVLVAVAWWMVTSGERETPTADQASPSETDSGASGGASDGGETEEPPPAEPRAEDMRAFIGDYLATAPNAPEQTFKQLTPSFQDASGGIEGYTGYWGTIESADLVDITADPEALTVAYTVDYVRTDGSETSDDVTLGLVFRKGRYLINEEG